MPGPTSSQRSGALLITRVPQPGMSFSRAAKGTCPCVQCTLTLSGRGCTARVAFCGVFDGHGGSNCARLAAQQLHERVLAAGLLAAATLQEGAGGGVEEVCVDGKAARSAIVAGFKALDAHLLEQCERHGGWEPKGGRPGQEKGGEGTVWQEKGGEGAVWQEKGGEGTGWQERALRGEGGCMAVHSTLLPRTSANPLCHHLMLAPRLAAVAPALPAAALRCLLHPGGADLCLGIAGLGVLQGGATVRPPWRCGCWATRCWWPMWGMQRCGGSRGHGLRGAAGHPLGARGHTSGKGWCMRIASATACRQFRPALPWLSAAWAHADLQCPGLL